ncbi:Lrp/AsnC family transcriptional regulator [Candidatus Micrarchaeota archaeon]|nr:Lrp/AsnC family transcriptional regulator [Candidatus Micrarchaeota archaeon]MBU1165783.1 Lrp/AsnC family transcriptional regulator [Candidatus Micrarchaeota archaeon]MBU1886301.1 Lrp/AsnC family transcriptional regulator [Candidatus Micrarchaeota archaeon]
MDKIDRRIIHALDTNSRAQNTEIAKNVGISKQLLKYRLGTLLNHGVIEKFYTVINGVKFGLIYFRVYIRLQGVAEEQEAELIQSLISNPYITWVVKCRGQWDLIISIYAKDTEHFSNNFQSMVDKFQKNILKKKIVLIRNVIFLTRNYLSEDANSFVSVYGGVTENIKMDEREHKILFELARNSRITILSLAEKAHTAPDTVRSKIKKLEKSGIIKAHKVAISYSKTNILFFLVSVTLSSTSEVSRKKLEDYCKSHSNVIYLVNLLGDHEMDLEIEVNRQEEIDNLLRDLRNKFPNIIRDMETTQITGQHKLEYYPFRENPTK